MTGEQSFERYLEYHASKTELSDACFEAIWAGIERYVAAIVRNRTSCCEFDRDDHRAEIQIAIWQGLRARRLPIKSVALFMGAVQVTACKVLIDRYRTSEAAARAESTYIEVASRHVEEPQDVVAENEIRLERAPVIAHEMAKRARFTAVSEELCHDAAVAFLTTPGLRSLPMVLREVVFWDKEFLLVYLLVLFRWVCYDMNEELF